MAGTGSRRGDGYRWALRSSCSAAPASCSMQALSRATPSVAILANVFTWLWLLVFLGYGRQHLSASNRLLAWSRDASYPIYILHQTVIIGIGYFVVQIAWRPWSKYWLVLGATLLTCVLVYEGVLRRFAVLRLLFGIKTEEPVPPAPVAVSLSSD